MERTLTTMPAVDAPSMIFPKFPHPLSIDVRISVSLDVNKTNLGISIEPFCNTTISSPVFPSCTSTGDRSDRWMCPGVLVNESLGECLLSLQFIQLI